MNHESDDALDRLWEEYTQVFGDLDDLTLARWMSQTLSQLSGRLCRYSHPLIGTYRMASVLAHERHIWLKRLVTIPANYAESECCRAPMLPIFTREVLECGLVCHHCSETLIPFDDMPPSLQPVIQTWAEAYDRNHAVAHWEDEQREQCDDYEAVLEKAKNACCQLFEQAATSLLPPLLEFYPLVLWEDQDECLGIRPEDIVLP